MNKYIKKKKWRFLQMGSTIPTGGIDLVNSPEYLAMQKEIEAQNALLQQRMQESLFPSSTTIVNSNQQEPSVSQPTDSNTVNTTSDSQETGQTKDMKELEGTRSNMQTGFSTQDYTQGIGALLQSTNLAKQNDGKVTADELGGIGLDTGVAMSGPYGQVANAAISIGEGVLGDELYQGLGEGVEYEKGASRAAKGALKGAAIGAKIGGPWGAAIGAVGGAGLNLIGQGKRKREAMNEFEKRRDERIRNMNQQSKALYASQYQQFYKKGGEVVKRISIKPENKGKFK